MKTFEVEVTGEIEPYRAEMKAIIFHGVNKSGSMCLSNVFRTAYILASRRDEFYCHYHRDRVEFDDLLRNIEGSVGPALFISHNLYGAVKLNPQQVMVSMFRHPLPRVVSGYQWVKNRFVENGGVAEEFESLEEFVEKGNGITWSQIAQFGIGYDPEVRRRKWTLTAPETYQLCMENIERDLHWFGIAELFEETIFVFAAICGLSRVPAWERDLRNPGRTLASELSPANQEMIRHYYRYDFELYDHVLALFRKRLSRLQLGGDFASYKAACAAEYKESPLEDQAVAGSGAA